MTGGTTATSSESAEDARTTVERRWMSIVFLLGEAADAVLDMIESTGSEVAIRHLAHWDYGDETRDAALVHGYVYNEIPLSPTDPVIHGIASTHALAYNRNFRYVSLLRHFPQVVEEPPHVVARAGSLASAHRRTARRTDGLRL